MDRERSGRATAARVVVGVLVLVAAAAGLAALVLALGLGDRDRVPLGLGDVVEEAGGVALGEADEIELPPPPEDDPLAWDESRRVEFETRAATGLSHVIYARSPGGAVASARRTARWRDRIETAAERQGVDADVLEAIVFLESAGRPEVSAGPTPRYASGLAQIMPSTATDLLGMEVDLEQSIRLTRAIERADRPRRANRLRERRAEIDERFDPDAALAGAARYLDIAIQRFGAEDLAIASYHMGIGNLESVIRAYLGVAGDDPTGPLVDATDLSYAQLYFDATPDRHPRTHEILYGFEDESENYLWKVRASEGIMRNYRRDRAQLERTAALATAKGTLEEVFHPEDETEVFEAPDDIAAALAGGRLLPLPEDRALGWLPHRRMGELAENLDQPEELYRALRPGALATLNYIGSRVRELSDVQSPLQVTSTVRDRRYQALLGTRNHEATDGYSLHTTGWSFDVLREYRNRRQARAFQHILDRLRALAVIDYAVEPRAIHVTVSKLGRELLPDE